MKYQLNEIEHENLDKFLLKLPKKYKNKPVELIFDGGSGIGVSILARVCDREKDITDYGCW